MVIRRIDSKIRHHYEVEKKLAKKLMSSEWEERKLLYKTLYDELFREVPWHPRLLKKEDERVKQIELTQQLQLLDRYINKDTVYLEVGPGDCNLALALTKIVKKVFTVDISDDLIKTIRSQPPNFEFIKSDGRDINVPENSIDVAFSSQVIEHFHPEDVVWHIKNIRDALKPGGIYIFLTPHRFKGPCDVSKYFDQEATGLHLKEWTFTELLDVIKKSNYTSGSIHSLIRGVRLVIPKFGIKIFEYCAGKLPYGPRKKIADLFLKGRLYIVAKK